MYILLNPLSLLVLSKQHQSQQMFLPMIPTLSFMQVTDEAYCKLAHMYLSGMNKAKCCMPSCVWALNAHINRLPWIYPDLQHNSKMVTMFLLYYAQGACNFWQPKAGPGGLEKGWGGGIPGWAEGVLRSSLCTCNQQGTGIVWHIISKLARLSSYGQVLRCI